MAESKEKKIGNYIVYGEKVLGSGGFGVVYQCRHDDGRIGAAKEINLLKAARGQGVEKTMAAESIPKEKNLSHPNICQIWDVKEDFTTLWVFMELCQTDLFKYHPNIDSGKAVLIAVQCSEALKYLHDRNITHRDLKPDNVLLVEIDKSPLVKLTDFSLAKDLSDASDSYMTTVKGNTAWLAPDMLNVDGSRNAMSYFTKAIDIFTLGLIIIFINLNEEGIEKSRKEPIGCLVKQGVDILQYLAGHWRYDLGSPLASILHTMLDVEHRKRLSAGDLNLQMREALPSAVCRMEEMWQKGQGVSDAEVRGATSRADDKPPGVVQELCVVDLEYGHTIRFQRAGAWQEITTVPEGYDAGSAACATPRGIFLTGCGSELPFPPPVCMEYVAADAEWRDLPDMMTGRAMAAAVMLDASTVMVIGGCDSELLSSCEALNLDNPSACWQPLADMKQGMREPITARCIAYVIVLFNTDSIDNHTKQSEITLQRYVISENKWEYGSPLPASIGTDTAGVSACTIGDRVMFAGGLGRLCAVYTPHSDTWEGLARPHQGHRHGALVAFAGKVLIMGGWDGSSNTSVIEAYHHEKDTWTVSDDTLWEDMMGHKAFVITQPQ